MVNPSVKTYKNSLEAVVVLDDGTAFFGNSISGEGTSFGEICFNTGMTGYQEIFTDPSYYNQIMVMANAHVGNYGVHPEDSESNTVKISGLICRNFSYHHSRPSGEATLEEFLKKDNIFGITGVDTRALVSYIRENGTMNAVISTRVDEVDTLRKELSEKPTMQGLELASRVSTKKPYFFGKKESKYKVAVLDLGVKKSILNKIALRDVYIKVFPHDTSYNQVKAWQPDGYFISNGPGDPEPLQKPIDFVKSVIADKKPLFGICLGHQVLALANGISTFKMHHGHRGINHPVINLATAKGEITSQNHGFAVDRSQVEKHPLVSLSHVHINDDSVAGIEMNNELCFSVQYHPEANPGPNDADYLFDKFIEIIKRNKNGNK